MAARKDIHKETKINCSLRPFTFPSLGLPVPLGGDSTARKMNGLASELIYVDPAKRVHHVQADVILQREFADEMGVAACDQVDAIRRIEECCARSYCQPHYDRRSSSERSCMDYSSELQILSMPSNRLSKKVALAFLNCCSKFNITAIISNRSLSVVSFVAKSIGTA